jgi:hypothetical protein
MLVGALRHIRRVSSPSVMLALLALLRGRGHSGVVVGCGHGNVEWDVVTCLSRNSLMPHIKQDAEKKMLISYLLFTYINGCLAELVSMQNIDHSRSWVQFLL